MIQKIKKIVGKENVILGYPLSLCSSFGIGGNAKIIAYPTSVYEVVELIKLAKDSGLKHKVIGNASNILFSDAGYDGLIISLKNFSSIERVDETSYLVSAGTSLSALLARATKDGLSGIEFAAGIPALLGGAIVMNAGVGAKSMSDILNSVTFFDGKHIITKQAKELEFNYRTSCFCGSRDFIVLFAKLVLKKENQDVIKNNIKEYLDKRLRSQPKGKSAGCVFKNPKEMPAGYIIDKLGLKGLREGGAVVSEVHANFIINESSATQVDVKTLINKIKTEVYNCCGVWLEEEIEIL